MLNKLSMNNHSNCCRQSGNAMQWNGCTELHINQLVEETNKSSSV